jgi:hypothetical protein
MVKRKTISPALTKAEQRIVGFRAVNPAMSFGEELNLANYQATIDRTRQNMNAYNTALIAVEAAQKQLKDEEKQLAFLNEHLMLSVAAHYGTDSLEYKQSGGVRKSDRKRSRKPKAKAEVKVDTKEEVKETAIAAVT